MGAAGQELTRMLLEVGIKRGECFLTNVFALQPQNNNIETLCCTKKDLPSPSPMPPIAQGKYIQPDYLPEVARLKEELSIVRPNLVIALGNISCWALLGTRGITSIRGVATMSTLIPDLKVLPTYHPAYILRQWQYRVIAIADLMKALKEAQSPFLSRPARRLLVDPTLDEIREWIAKFSPDLREMSVDIETHRRQIEMIGFSASPYDAMVVPFMVRSPAGNFLRNYWDLLEDEITARRLCQDLLLHPCEKIFQNGLYDMQYLLREGFKLRNVAQDTMLLHHSMYPELEKGLGFLGSIYTNEASWKLLGRQRADEPVKKDD